MRKRDIRKLWNELSQDTELLVKNSSGQLLEVIAVELVEDGLDGKLVIEFRGKP
jgi:hypothetical protein